MNFLLDRFPVETYTELKNTLEDLGHKIPLTVLTIQSKSLDFKIETNHFFDRDVALGIVTKNTPMILNNSEIKEASKYEGLAINSFSRYDTTQGNFSAQEMSNHYYELYNFWLYQIKTYKIDFCFHHYLPHDPSSLVLYLVLKHKKIPAIFVDVPIVLNKFRMLSCSLQHRSLLLENKNDKSKFDFYENFKKFQKSLLNNEDDAIPLALKFRTEKKTKFNLYLKYQNKINKILKLIMTDPYKAIKKIWEYYFGLENAFFKISRHSWASKKNNIFKIQYFFFTNILKLKLLLKLNHYESKCIKNITGEYIYFAMPAQPEGTTLPTALEFTNVVLVLKIIREAIPQEIQIIVKENLSVFETRNPYISGVNYRSPDFYDELLKIPNLKFVSIKKNSHEIIKNAKLVAAINGTAIIEATAFGKPAITFGSNWYDNIDYIHKFISIDKLRDFYKKNLSINENLTQPSSFKIQLDKDMMFEIKKHNAYQINIDERKKLIKSFIRSIDKFKKIDDRKWDV